MLTVHPLSISSNTPNGETFIFPTLIKTTTELILVDAGYPGQADALFAAVAEEGLDLKALSKIVLTHHDFDHVGSLKEIKKRCPHATVITSAEEAPFINGSKKALRMQQAEAIYSSLPEEAKEGAKAFEAFLKSILPCEVDRTVKAGEAIDAEGLVVVVATPGHTSGHISLFLPSLQTVIAGDAVVFEAGALLLANPAYAYNLAQAKASAEKLREMNPAIIICYHGGVCPDAQQTPHNI